MTECLDEEAILSFCRGSMVGEKRRAAEAHIAECEECRVLVSAVMRSSLVDWSERPNLSASDPAMDPTTPLQGGLGPGADSLSESPVSAPVRAGDIVAGKYAVERVLGAGGMGVVVAARHTQLDQRFALKFLLPAACETPGATARFLREGKAAARITSEHVARVVDTGTLDTGAPYLVMEYLEGSDLGAVGRLRGPMPAMEVVEYVLQACEAIVEAHELGIVHRDLKPANLFLTKRKDGSPLVKVLDFGISKAEGGSETQLTSTSMLMGSPRYMSPEQMVSAKDVDARTDIWALGIILHELVTGKPVWHADTVQGLCALIATAPAPPLRRLVPDAPAGLEDVVLRCLTKAPADRTQSVAELAVALEPIAPERARMSIERILGVAGHRRSQTSALVPSAASIPAASASVAAQSREGPAPSSGGRVVVLLGAIVGLLVVAGIALNALVLHGRHVEATSTNTTPAVSVSAIAVTGTPAPSAPSASAPVRAQVQIETPPPLATLPAVKAAPRRAADPARIASARVPEPSPVASHPTPESAPNRALSDRK